MPNRFTATEKWERPWFRDLPTEYKMLWIYLCDNCDQAGVWYIDMKLACFQIGSDVSIEMALELFTGRVVVLPCGKRWHIPDFIPFQYGVGAEVLTVKSTFHRGALNAMIRAGLPITKEQSDCLAEGSVKGFGKPLQSLKKGLPKALGLGLGLGLGKDKGGVGGGFTPPTIVEVTAYCQERGKGIDPEAWLAHYQANGWRVGRAGHPMRNWKAAVVTWEKNSSKTVTPGQPGKPTEYKTNAEFYAAHGIKLAE